MIKPRPSKDREGEDMDVQDELFLKDEFEEIPSVCPHCLHALTPQSKEQNIGQINPRGEMQVGDYAVALNVAFFYCPTCNDHVVYLAKHFHADPPLPTTFSLLYPKHFSLRKLAVKGVIEEPYASDYEEANLVVPYSQKASAALCRRIMESLLHKDEEITKTKLKEMIDEAKEKRLFSTTLQRALHFLREIGNFAAHEQKELLTGEILDVELGEAEWSLRVVESLFDHYFIAPKTFAKFAGDQNKKLKSAGRKTIDWEGSSEE